MQQPNLLTWLSARQATVMPAATGAQACGTVAADIPALMPATALVLQTMWRTSILSALDTEGKLGGCKLGNQYE